LIQSKTIPLLIVRAQQGNSDAAGQLYQRHYKSIFRYLAYRTGDTRAAEDLTADVFLKMVQALPNYRASGAAFRTWLFQIARNLSIDHFRRNHNHPQEAIQDGIPADDGHPEDLAEQRLTSRELSTALSVLSEEQRDVVLMRFVEGMPIAEVAAALHKSEDSIKGLQRRALLALRELLEPMEDENERSFG
jgi:RNA polymerase sigma-70 factor (ECF subfamily)